MGVENYHPKDDRERDHGHAPRLSLEPPSGQLSAARVVVGDPLETVNAKAAPGHESSVVAASSLDLAHGPREATRPHTADPLVARAAAGDAGAFRALFVRHRADVARLVHRMASHADVEDVVQEVFVQVFRSLPEFRGQAKFTTWLHRVTVNVVLMHRRSAKSRPVLTEEAPGDVADERAALPDEDAERRERMRAFQRLLARLADKKRIVFVLHELEGMTPSEIAEVVEAPVLTVRTRLFYARRELEAMLHEEPSLGNLHASFSTRKEGSR